MLKPVRHLRTLLFGAVIALMVGLLGPVSPATAAGPITGLNPVITGPAVVGETLTAAQVGATSPQNNVTFTWQWQTTGTTPTDIVGATTSTLLLTPELAGQQVQVVMTAHSNGKDDSSATSTATATILHAFTAPPTVDINTVAAVVGENIEAVVPTESTPVADSYTWAWFADGSPISGATAASYTPTASDVGKQLVAKATAVKVNYAPITGESATTLAVVKADFTGTLVATISGTPAIGSQLTANTSGVTPTPDTFTYQWKADNVDIGSATSSTFTPNLSHAGKAITVTVTASKAGYNDLAPATSAATAAVGNGTFSTPPTAFLSTLTPKVGDVVTAHADGEAPIAESYQYQWYRISTLGVRTAIPGGFSQSYTVVYNDLTKRLQVEVYAVKAGYTTQSDLSVPTNRVNYIALNKTTVKRAQTLGVTAKRLRAGQTYRIFIDGKSVYSGTASSEGNAIRTIGVPSTTPVGTKRVWVSGYNKAGTRDFQVITTVIVQ